MFTSACAFDGGPDVHKVALGLAPRLGRRVIERLLQHFGSAQRVFDASASQLKGVAGIGDKLASGVLTKNLKAHAAGLLKACRHEKVRVLMSGDIAYPKRLKHTRGAPFMLFAQGEVDFNAPRVLSIVGTRRPTRQAKAVIMELLEMLKPLDVLIVSGLAYGIDSWAHEAALAVGLRTVAVLPSGVARIYPAANTQLVKDMLAAGGGLVSEYGLYRVPDKSCFAARNRIIAGVADATVVIEAPRRSGALITAQFANDYDREVFAVPGNWATPQAMGCNQLIKQHQAHILTSAADLVALLDWGKVMHQRAKGPIYTVLPSQLGSEERFVIESLRKYEAPMHVELLSSSVQLPICKLNTLLLNLELHALVTKLPGSYFVAC